jgi:hypothetical protein
MAHCRKPTRMPTPTLKQLAASLGLWAALAPGVGAQGVCSSDGQPQPVRLLERFLSADCERCWGTATALVPSAAGTTLALDWIVPGRRGDDAPLSAAASRDALARLQALHRAAPREQLPVSTAVAGRDGATVRVAHGVALGAYIGDSIEARIASTGPPAAAPLTAVLLLVETIAAGSDGTPIERNLVRNMLQVPWNGASSLSNKEQPGLLERRPLSIPEGTNPQRLRVVGWLQDGRGRVLAAAQSACLPDAAGSAPP